jgi:hypothetical protein
MPDRLQEMCSGPARIAMQPGWGRIAPCMAGTSSAGDDAFCLRRMRGKEIHERW